MWRKILQIIGVLAAVLSLLPLLAADFWWIRIFDFLHVYFTAFTLVAILIYFFTFNATWLKDYLFVGILVACLCFQLFRISDYLGVYPVEVHDSTAAASMVDEIMVYTANVLKKNETAQPLFDQIKKLQPDLIVFTETDDTWQDRIQKNLGDLYLYKVSYPLDNTYGMILYSKLELIDPQVKFQTDPKIPSIHTKVRMKNGKMIQVYAIHPTPPMPQHNPKSTDRDQELLKTAVLSYQSDLPVIVMGDFNDVSWSGSTQLTKSIGKLLDPRIGRGIYATFSAQSRFMRWPLDHILSTSDFRYVNSGVGTSFGSDHFPLWTKFTLETNKKDDQLASEPSDRDWEEAEIQLRNADLSQFKTLPEGLKKAMNR